MKQIFLITVLALFLFLGLTAHAQTTTANARRIFSGSGAPTVNCVVGPPFTSLYLRTDTGQVYYCSAAPNTWTVASAAGGVTANPTTGVIPYLSAANTYSDSPLSRLDANTIEQFNSTTAQALRVYAARTDASNYTRLSLTSDGNGALVATQFAGTGGGAAGNLTVGPAAAGTTLFLQTANSIRWQIDSNGHLKAQTDNTFDIGASGANRPRNYFGAGNGTFGGSLAVGSTGQYTINSSGLPTISNNLTLGGQGHPAILPVTSQKAETASADTNVLTITPTATVGEYRVCTSISVSSATSGVISWTLSWKDANANAQTNIAQQLFQMGTAAPNTTFTTSAAGNYYGCAMIDTDNSATAIVVKWVGGGTTAAKMTATVERIN